MKPSGACARSASSKRARPTPSAPSSRPRRSSGRSCSSKPASSASARRAKKRRESRSAGCRVSQATARAAVARVGGGQRALAETRGGDQQDQRARAVLDAAARAGARAAARAAPGPGHPRLAVPRLRCGTLCLASGVPVGVAAKLRACCGPPGWRRATSRPLVQHWLFGCDATQASCRSTPIPRGRARVWRRVGERIETHRPPFSQLVSDHQPGAAGAPARRAPVGASALRAAHGELEPDAAAGGRRARLAPRPTTRTSYRYLVLTTQPGRGRDGLVETSNKGDGGEAQTLADLRGLVLVWQPIEQFLTLTGRDLLQGHALRRPAPAPVRPGDHRPERRPRPHLHDQHARQQRLARRASTPAR